MEQGATSPTAVSEKVGSRAVSRAGFVAFAVSVGGIGAAVLAGSAARSSPTADLAGWLLVGFSITAVGGVALCLVSWPASLVVPPGETIGSVRRNYFLGELAFASGLGLMFSTFAFQVLGLPWISFSSRGPGFLLVLAAGGLLSFAGLVTSGKATGDRRAPQ
jgi:hypothetical protein